MRRLYVLFMLLAVSMVGMAQQQKKWKAPKRPKRPKWEAPKQVAPEVIDVWRPYSVSDNWYMDFMGGTSISMAENTGGHGLWKRCEPLFDVSIGKQFSKVWSTRLALGWRRQKGWASEETETANALLRNSDYCYSIATGYVDEMVSLTNLLCPYNERRKLDFQMFVGAGVNYSWKFDKKTKDWERYGYPIDGSDHVNLALRGGLNLLMKISEAMDVSLQGTYNWVGDSYNGIKHAENFVFDPYMEVAIGFRVHIVDHFGDYRYCKVRRWEASALRAEDHKIAELLENEKRHEYVEREASEVVAFGELMKTHISFYIDRSYVNDSQMENLRIVADFLKRHPDVNLVVKGYCGASAGSESPNMHLAERRVASVKKVLLRNFNVEPSRFETWFDEEANAPYPMEGEWIDGVVFQMITRE